MDFILWCWHQTSLVGVRLQTRIILKSGLRSTENAQCLAYKNGSQRDSLARLYTRLQLFLVPCKHDAGTTSLILIFHKHQWARTQRRCVKGCQRCRCSPGRTTVWNNNYVNQLKSLIIPSKILPLFGLHQGCHENLRRFLLMDSPWKRVTPWLQDLKARRQSWLLLIDLICGHNLCIERMGGEHVVKGEEGSTFHKEKRIEHLNL